VHATCPRGHASTTIDYCDKCGDPIARVPDEHCPVCNATRRVADRYCEHDGYDYVAGAVPATHRSWAVIVAVDHDYFERVAPNAIEFPTDVPGRQLPLTGDDILIGRRSRSRGIFPDIDLSIPPEDPGVSHMHARLVRGADGAYALVDLGSTNGTTMNADPTPIPPETAITVTDGDRIHVGAWTTITVRLAPANGLPKGSEETV
jgi:hypothetical protein